MISKATIDTVFETARVEEVIGDFVNLKRAGSNFKGLSPFSDERSPSFMVSPAKGIWKDFSSGKGGNSVAFLMEHSHFTYPEAIRYLAKKYNIEIEETEQTDEEKAITDVRESMYLVSEFAKDYFHKTFSLGYSPESWDAFTKEAFGKGYKLEFLESTGLTIAREDRPFDRFKGRVMFPIESMSGRILGFGGRILTNDKKAAKYLNSPESDIYHKSKVLYGIFQAKQAIAKLNNCYLVEGYTDVIQFNQAGIENVVASSGTALTPDQIRLVNRLTKNITVLFADGEDPDSFAKKTSYDDLVAYLETNAKDFIQFKASMLMDEAKNDPIKKADLIRDMVLSISKIPDRIQREIYIQECSRIMDISEQVLMSTLAQLVQKDVADVGKKQKQEQGKKSFEVIKNEGPAQLEKVDVLGNVEREIIRILLLYGNRTENFEEILMKSNEEGEIIEVSEFKELKVFQKIFLSLQEDEIEFASPVFRTIYDDLINYYLQNENSGVEKYINHLQSGVPDEVTSIMMDDEKYVLHDWIGQNIFPKTIEETLNQGVSDTLFTLRWFLISEIIENLKNAISNEPGADNMESLSLAMSYIELRGKFSKKLGRVVVRYH